MIVLGIIELGICTYGNDYIFGSLHSLVQGSIFLQSLSKIPLENDKGKLEKGSVCPNLGSNFKGKQYPWRSGLVATVGVLHETRIKTKESTSTPAVWV